MATKILFLLLNLAITFCVDNGLGLTPQMGWNSWNHFGCNISEELIKKTADMMIRSGLV
jgi:alpha-galactosidase